MDVQSIVENFVDEMIENRVYQVAYEKVKQDEDYIKINNKESAIFQTLMDSLDNQNQKILLIDLANAYDDLEIIYLKYSYLQGLQDSDAIKQAFKRINNIRIEDEDEKVS